uniref:Uncharacterized protein n=1 Tax=Pseudomonas phage HRDY3 TaxID=3236930 RepID=A0AB39CEQ5_9VIRU
MRPLTIVKTKGPGRQYWIAHNVTRREARVMNVDGPGVHLFSGYWYAGFGLKRDWDWHWRMRTDFRHHDAFGKVAPVPKKRADYKVVARGTRNSYLVRKLMR